MDELIKELEKFYGDEKDLIKKFYEFFKKVITNEKEATKEEREVIDSLIKKLKEQLEAVREDNVQGNQAIKNTEKEKERLETLVRGVSGRSTPQEKIAYNGYTERIRRLSSKLVRLHAVAVMESVLPMFTPEEVEEIQESLDKAVHDIYQLKLAREFISLMTELSKKLIKLAVKAV